MLYQKIEANVSRGGYQWKIVFENGVVVEPLTKIKRTKEMEQKLEFGQTLNILTN